MQQNLTQQPRSAPFEFSQAAMESAGVARLEYVRKVYTFFGIGIVGGVLGSLVSMNTDVVFLVGAHPLIGMIAFFALAFVAVRSSGNPDRALPALGAFTFGSGLLISPILYAVANSYVPGAGVGTIYNALIISSSIFGGLTLYAFTSKKDFSYMGASLMVGLFLIIGASIANIFLHSTTVDLALAIMTGIIFSGFILVDTSRILRRAHEVPPTLAALNLYLDFLNLFLAVLRILSGGNRR